MLESDQNRLERQLLRQSEFMKALANPVRLRLLGLLEDGEKSATDLVKLSGISKASLSQHIKLMKSEGLVLCNKQGRFCFYRIADTRILAAVELLHETLSERT